MDDLTKLPLVGKSTARKLVAAGIDSFAKIGSISFEDLRTVILHAGPEELQRLREAANALVEAAAAPAPIDLGTASPAQVHDHAARIDAARSRLATAQSVIHVAQDDSLVAAQAELSAAQQELDALIGPGQPSSAPIASGHTSNTPQSEAQNGEAGNSAGLPHGEGEQTSGDESAVTIVVYGPAKGRWRLGRLFGPSATVISVNATDLEAIDADPALSWSLEGEV